MNDYENKVALLTGASGGIGKELAKRLAKLKINLAILGRDKGKLSSLKEELEKEGVKVKIYSGSLEDDKFLFAIADKVKEDFGGIDILINNAGATLNSKIEETKIEDYDRIMRLNARAPFVLMKETLKYLRESSYATVINICSIVGHVGYVNQGVYSASKHALLGLSQSFAKENYKDGIRLHVITPGGVFTDMIKISRPDLTDEGMILPKDIADIMEFFITHRSNAVVDEIVVHRLSKEPF